ncbi:MAG: PAS domain S-box protein [Bacteroidia bacterium]
MDKTDRYAVNLENSLQIYFLTKPTGEILDCNQMACKVFGYSREEIKQLGRNGLIVNDETLQHVILQREKNGEVSCVLTGIKKDGEKFPLELWSKIFFDEGSGENRTIIIGQDISARQSEEEKKAEAEKELRRVIEAVNVGIVVHNEQDQIIHFNNKALELLNVSEDFLLGKTAQHEEWQLLKENFEPYTFDEVPSTVARKQKTPILGAVIGVKSKNEHISWLIVDAKPTENSKGEPIVIVSFTDISAQKKMQHELQSTTRLLEQTNKEALIGGWEFDILTQKLMWTSVTRVIHEVNENFKPNIEKAINFYEPEYSKPQIEKAVQNLITRGEKYILELQIITEKGKKLWVRTTGNGEFINGNCTRIFGTFQDIDEQKKREITLSESRAEIVQIYNTISDVVFKLEVESSDKFKFVSVNDAFCQSTGHSKEEIIGHYTHKIIPEPSLTLVHKKYAEAIATGKSVEWKETTTYSGIEKTGIVRVNPMFNEEGHCTHLIGNVHDITEVITSAKTIQESLNKLNHQKFALDQHSIVAVTDARANIIYVNDKFCEISGYSREELIGQNHRIINSGIHPKSFFEHMYKTIYAGEVWHGDICNKRKDGTLYWVRTSIVPFNDSNSRQPLQFIAIRTDITKEKANLTALQRSEEYLRTIFDYSITAIIVADDEGKYLDVNPYTCHLFGYTKEEMLNMGVKDLKVASHKPGSELYKEYINKGVDQGEFHFYNKSGKLVSTLYQAIRVRENFNVSIMVDITERTEYESKLRQSESRIKTILESEPECIKIVDASGRILEMNPAGLNMIEASSLDDIQGKYALDIVHTEDREIYKLQHQKALSGENSMERFRIIGLNGTLRWLESNSVGFKENTTQKISVLSVSRDITKQVEADEKLKAGQQMLEQVFNTVSDVIYVLDIEPGFKLKYVTINYAFTKFTGLDLNERIGKYVDEAIDSTARELEVRKYKEAIAKKTTVTWRQTYHYPKGTRTAILSATPLFDTNNECTRLICSARDITDIIDSQNEIRKLSLIARETINGAVITDIEGKILWVNRAFEQISGYKLNELTGQKPGKLLQGKDTDPNMVKLMSESLKNKQPFDVEIINYTKSGTPYWIKIQCQPLVNSHDKVEGFFAIETDITHEVETKNEREFLIKELTENNNDLKQFTYITSHNLRSPLTNLVAIANLLEVPEDMDELNKKLIEGFKTSTYQLNETLDSLIKILLLKETTQISQQKIKFNDILDKILGSLSILIKENQVIIDTDFSEVDTVHFSPSYMESIFLNLITNSIKYKATNRPPHIQIKSYIRPECIMIKYTDNGSGFDADRVRNRVFGLFQRFHTNKDGKGIGLYLIKSQLSSLGGNIEVESKENKGTTFTLTFKRND